MTERKSDPELAGSMVDVLHEILEDEEMTFEELEDEIRRRQQAAIRHLIFTGEWERDQTTQEIVKRTVTVEPDDD